MPKENNNTEEPDFDVPLPIHEYDENQFRPTSEELGYKYKLVKVQHPTDNLKTLKIPQFV